MDELDVRELRCFLAVADELSFTRAAARLGMAQPPLSRAIRELERKLGVQLFVRSTRAVELTEAGQRLRAEGQPALDAMRALTNRMRRLAEPEPTLVVTVKAGSDAGLLREIVARYQADPALPRARFRLSAWSEQKRMLLDGRADVGLLRLPADTTGLDVAELADEPRMVALPIDHPLADKTDKADKAAPHAEDDNAGVELSFADLAEESVVVCPHADAVLAAHWAGRDGAHPPPVWPQVLVRDMSQILETVAFGQGVAFLPASTEFRYPRDDLAYRPVTGLSRSTVAVGWRAGSRAVGVAAFVRAACDVADTRTSQFLGLA